MSEEIDFDDSIAPKTTPELMDSDIKKMQEKAIKSIEQKQILEQEKIKKGIVTPPTEAEGVPKELPFLMFHYGSKIIKCDKFQTDDNENKILAHHLSIIFGTLIKNAWIWSLIAIFIIVIGKIIICKDAIAAKFGKKKEEQKTEDTQKVYEESKNADVTG